MCGFRCSVGIGDNYSRDWNLRKGFFLDEVALDAQVLAAFERVKRPVRDRLLGVCQHRVVASFATLPTNAAGFRAIAGISPRALLHRFSVAWLESVAEFLNDSARVEVEPGDVAAVKAL
jgi:hypothetical protein